MELLELPSNGHVKYTYPDHAYDARPSHEFSFDVHVFGITVTSWPRFRHAFTTHTHTHTHTHARNTALDGRLRAYCSSAQVSVLTQTVGPLSLIEGLTTCNSILISY